MDRGPARTRRTDWPAVTRSLAIADEAGTLDADGLARFGLALELTGRPDESVRAWDRAHRAYAAAGDRAAAARCVFWIGFTLDSRGRGAQSGGWGVRLAELADGEPPDSPTAALLTLARASVSRFSADGAATIRLFEAAAALADRLGDSDLLILALMGCGRALVAQGATDQGFACMDRVMLEIASGAAGDLVAGAGYCAVIASCIARRDVERAREWTGALSDWCDAQVGLVPFRGTCLLHRAVLLQIGAAWSEARSTLQGAGTLTGVTPGERTYRDGELLRLTGRTEEAEEAYRSAAAAGRDPQPRLALLRLQQGRGAAALAGVARALNADPLLGERADLLDAACVIRLALGDVHGARDAALELRTLAERVPTSYLRAQADRALGRVLVGEERAADALPLLRRAWSAWSTVGAPYEAAATRVSAAAAARYLGDEDAAGMELAAARSVFEELGALPDLQRVDEAVSSAPHGSDDRLTPREVEVVLLLAGGLSNREIAARLFLSEHTVARHVGNVLGKLQLANRAAVTAFAYEHRMVVPAG